MTTTLAFIHILHTRSPKKKSVEQNLLSKSFLKDSSVEKKWMGDAIRLQAEQSKPNHQINVGIFFLITKLVILEKRVKCSVITLSWMSYISKKFENAQYLYSGEEEKKPKIV